MPKVTQKQGGGYIVWDESDWSKGFLPQGGQGAGQILKGDGLRYAFNYDPYRASGFASPGFLPTNSTNMSSVTGAITATAMRNSTLLYGVTADGKLQEFNYSTNTVTNSGSFPYTINHAHAGETGSDIIIYRHKLGGSLTTSLFYSFYDATDWDVGCYESFTTLDDDFMSTDPTTPLSGTDLTGGLSLPHPMEVGADDVLYIGSGRYLHAYDGSGSGSNGNFISQVLTLPAGFIIQDLLKTEQYLLIAGVFSSGTTVPTMDTSQEAVVYLWNYVDLDVSDIIPLDDQFVSVLGLWRSRPIVITGGEKGNRGRNRVKVILGSNVQSVAEYDGSQPTLGGIDSSSDQLLINSSGKIITIGSPFNQNSYEVNNIASCSVTTQSGFIRNLFSSSAKIFASAGADLVQLNTNFATDVTVEGGFIEPSFATGKIGRVKACTIIYKGTVTSGTARLFACTLVVNYENDSAAVFSTTGVTAANLIQKVNYDVSGDPLPRFFNIGLKLDWLSGNGSSGAAQVSKVIVEFEEVDYSNS